MNRIARTLLCMLALLLALGGPLLVVPSAASGQQASNVFFSASARADGVVYRLTDPSLPLVPEGTVEASSTSAQALLDSSGQSRAFASAPYAGLLVTLPETMNGLLAGSAPPVPSYPFVVFSNHPTEPSVEQQLGPYELLAESDETSSRGVVRVAASTGEPEAFVSQTRAQTSFDPTSGDRVTEAVTRTSGIALGGVLTIGEVVTTARMSQSGDGAAEKSSGFRATALSGAGVPIEIREDGLHVGSDALPGVGLAQVNAVLAERDIAIEFLPKEETETSIVAAGLELQVPVTVPGRGEVTVTVIIGRASSSLESSALPGFDSPIGPPPPDGPDVAASAPSRGPELTPSAPPVEVPNAPTPGLPEVAAPSQEPAVAPSLSSAVPEDWTAQFYVAVVIAAATVLGGSRLLGLSGIRRDGAALAAKLRRPAPSLRLPS